MILDIEPPLVAGGSVWQTEAFADFMTGYMGNSRAGVSQAFAQFRATDHSYYVDDSWKARPNLTITLGLRYEFSWSGVSVGDGSMIVELTPRGRQRAADVIRRHRLAERLFTDSLALDSETEIEQQACKFEHILSPEATDKICTFLGHPETCPHGAPIPRGQCCANDRHVAAATVERERHH